MKSILTILLILIAFTGFAQNTPMACIKKQAVLDVREDKVNTVRGITSEHFPEDPIARFEEILNLQSPFDLIQVEDSIITWEWDYDNQVWGFDTKTIDIIYDADQQLTSYTNQEWSGTQWGNVDQYNITYDENGNQIEYIRTEWDGFGWQNSTRFQFTYDLNDNVLSGTYSNWDGIAWVYYYRSMNTYDQNENQTLSLLLLWENNDWVNVSQTLFNYDGSNNLLEELDQSWNGSAWQDDVKITRTYDLNNNLKIAISQSWNGVALENHYRYEFLYDEDQYEIIATSQEWDGIDWVYYRLVLTTYDEYHNISSETIQKAEGGSEWINEDLYTYAYDQNSNLTYDLEQAWNGFEWENVYQTFFEYDDQSNLTMHLVEVWYGEWLDYDLTVYTYDENNYELSNTYKGYDFGELVYGDSTYYYFHTVTGVHDQSYVTDLIGIYPNPGNGLFTLASEEEIHAVTVYNVVGEMIYSVSEDKGNRLQTMDLSDQGASIYFAHIKTDHGIETRKILIQ